MKKKLQCVQTLTGMVIAGNTSTGKHPITSDVVYIIEQPRMLVPQHEGIRLAHLRQFSTEDLMHEEAVAYLYPSQCMTVPYDVDHDLGLAYEESVASFEAVRVEYMEKKNAGLGGTAAH